MFEVDECLQPIIRYFFEVGPTYGEQVIPWHEIAAWERGSGTEVTPFIRETLRMMSAEYLSFSHKAKEESCPNPTLPEDDQPKGRRDRPDEDDEQGQPKQKQRALSRRKT